uniref:Uncharacterized protein n=1 Tax=Pseudo-nitzschia delicatissima TaxID=44447 RepID=A0A7S0XL56_9STRA|mmetsp:Transcript_159/g.366  ORF Transcript_159/g.366 Transcript_159/m.366 type:complete len:300 (+) Transcript_159:348-1247(+)|eukprot:CAMPEP_0116087398 /NCGR_PEP_ID=MMETSP0327-20121206/5342_1 /TAXON_ID=44447 /ORGANISM="Pseudo-nitzschia delicatissima, Strain B596" /LENGTH=299 /DNA_ID=CAMNT_0003578463 /DNA_START=321 /DNA_END=1220 /DNA_ORIENTATION=-
MTNQESSRTVDATTVSPSRNVRFALRKKRNFSERSRSDGNPVTLSSYNSDFLSGLFADVAKANVLKELSIELPSSSTPSTETACPPSMFDVPSSHIVPDSMNSPRPLKKSRVSFRASSCRSRASCLNLLSQSKPSDVSSPKGINEISSIEKSAQDSLAYQLNCLVAPSTRSVSPTNKSKKVSKDVAALAFPNLPSTVSDSSCESNNVTATGLTRERCLIQHGSAPEKSTKESFGWFVDLDDNQDTSPFNTVSKCEKSISSQDLAFKAPTAPKQAADHVQEEMEQAYAADTIDSVLGDFF